jgi:hypothetical protein
VPEDRKGSAWHSVSLVIKANSCEAAQACRGKRFLSKQAPRLPLAECTAPGSCPCAYKHHNDRRGNPRRKSEVTGLKRTNTSTTERRATRGRRETDL